MFETTSHRNQPTSKHDTKVTKLEAAQQGTSKNNDGAGNTKVLVASQSSLVALIMDWFIGCVFSCVFSRLLGSRLWMIWCVIYVQRPVFSSHLLDPSFCLGNSFSGVSSSFIFVFVIFGLHFVLSFFFCPFCVPLDFFSKKP